MGYDWDTWLWCPLSLESSLDESCVGEGDGVTLEVSHVYVFDTDVQGDWDAPYDCGVNIHVKKI